MNGPDKTLVDGGLPWHAPDGRPMPDKAAPANEVSTPAPSATGGLRVFDLSESGSAALIDSVRPMPMDPEVQWQCSNGHVVHRSREVCVVCGALQADEREPVAVPTTPTVDSSTPLGGS